MLHLRPERLLLALAFVISCADDSTPGRWELTAIDGQTGQTLWSAQRRGGVVSVDPFAPPGEVAFYSASVCADLDSPSRHDARTGDRLPGAPPPGGYSVPDARSGAEACATIQAGRDPRVGQRYGALATVGHWDSVCFFTVAGDLLAIEATGGSERFRVPTQSDWVLDLDGNMFGVSGIAVGGTGNGTIRLFSRDDGGVRWQVPAVDESMLTVGDTIVVLGGAGPSRRALSLLDGRELWRRDLQCDQLDSTHDVLVCANERRAQYCKYPND